MAPGVIEGVCDNVGVPDSVPVVVMLLVTVLDLVFVRVPVLEGVDV